MIYEIQIEHFCRSFKNISISDYLTWTVFACSRAAPSFFIRHKLKKCFWVLDETVARGRKTGDGFAFWNKKKV